MTQVTRDVHIVVAWIGADAMNIADGCPCRIHMARIAVFSRHKMVAGFSLCRFIVMTGYAIASYILMIKLSATECGRCVAPGTVASRCYMCT